MQPQRRQSALPVRNQRQSIAPQGLASSQQSSQGSQTYVAPATVARAGSTYGGGVALGWSGARGDAGHMRASYAPGTT